MRIRSLGSALSASALVILALLALSGCKQGEGERCQIDSDCGDDLVCSESEEVCVSSTSVPLADSAPAIADAAVAVADGPRPDVTPAQPDAGPADASAIDAAAAPDAS